MGAYHTGSCFWSTEGGAVLWTAPARVAGGLCTLVWGLLSAGRDCLCGGAPCGRGPGAFSVWSAPQGSFFLAFGSGARLLSLSDRCSGSELVCLYVRACVRVWVCLSPYLSGYLWGWEGWCILSLLFLASVRHYVLLLKYERCHTNKIWFVLIWNYLLPLQVTGGIAHVFPHLNKHHSQSVSFDKLQCLLLHLDGDIYYH